MKISEIITTLMAILFILFIIVGGVYFFYLAFSELKSYQTFKNECNQDKNRDLCFCSDFSCVVKYSCSTDCEAYEKRLCEIATKANDKEWMWRFCE